MKKILALVLALCMMLCGVAVAETYTATVEGHNGNVTVEVAIEDGKITAVNVTEHSETTGISDKPIATIPAAIVENQSVAIDAVAGASVTSGAILSAVKDCIAQAGLNVADYEVAVEEKAVEVTDETLTADVVIIGAGGAGLAAAIEADKAAAKVIIVEKMAAAGGTTLLSGGYYNAVDPTRQQLSGVEDSVEQHIQQTYEGGDKVANLELVTKLCSEATENMLWLESMGMKFNMGITTATGAIWPRSHKAVEPNGEGYIHVLLDALEGTDVEILYETKATEILMNEGRACGIKAESANVNYTLEATKGVIIASGGFGSNIEMRQAYNTIWPTLDESVRSSNTIAATGAGLVVAQAVGANLVGMEYIQLHPLGNPETGNFLGAVSGDVETYLQVNLEGKRYIAEDSRRDELCKAALQQTDGLMWQLTSGESLAGEYSVMLGYGYKADSVEELAAEIDIEPGVLGEALNTYNAGVDAGKDELGRGILTYKFDTAPYYATLRCVTVHHTMGGIEINTEAQVLDAEGNVIPALYAAGEVTGGIHGGNRLGGNALADAIVFGRTAGQNAANAK